MFFDHRAVTVKEFPPLWLRAAQEHDMHNIDIFFVVFPNYLINLAFSDLSVKFCEAIIGYILHQGFLLIVDWTVVNQKGY